MNGLEDRLTDPSPAVVAYFAGKAAYRSGLPERCPTEHRRWEERWRHGWRAARLLDRAARLLDGERV